MIEVSVIEVKGSETRGHGMFLFSFPPRIGEIVSLPSSAPSLEFYAVESVEHAPVLPEAVRPKAAKTTPSVTLFVRWSHDYDPA